MVNGKRARVFTRRTAAENRRMVLGSTQRVSDVHAAIFVDILSVHVKFLRRAARAG